MKMQIIRPQKKVRPSKFIRSTVLVKSFAHLHGNFFLASLEEIGKLWKWWTVYSGELIFSYSTMFKVSPPLSGGSQKIHSIKCAKLLTSTVHAVRKMLGCLECKYVRRLHFYSPTPLLLTKCKKYNPSICIHVDVLLILTLFTDNPQSLLKKSKNPGAVLLKP